MKDLDVYTVLDYLPHRYPFMLIDKIVECEPGKTLHAIKNVTFNEPHFTGHFPEQPVMPGVLIVEALAQACGILNYLSLGRKPAENEVNYLVGVDNARFKQVVIPGDVIHLHVEIIKSKRGISKFVAKALVNGNVACEAEIMNASRTVERD